MTHFALISSPFPSHVRAFEALSEALRRRGHLTTFLLPEGGCDLLRLADAAVETVGGREDLTRLAERATRPTGPLGILRTVRDTARMTDTLCASAPAILGRIGADAVIGDEMEPAAGLVAAYLRLPLVSIACALPIDPDPAVPPPFVHWPYDPSADGLKRNRGGERVARLFLRRQRRVIEDWALRFGLVGWRRMEDCLSPLVSISQTVPSFDFPRRGGTLRHVGPIRGPVDEGAALPFTVDATRPLVFASLGTMQGHRLAVFRAIAHACRALGAQLVLAHCGGLTPAEAASLDADYVTDFLPQRAVLAKADVCITHAGLNTVLDALEFGVPLLAIPIAFDQPGVAARIVHHRVGLRLSRVLLSREAVRASLARLIVEEGFRSRAMRIGAEIRASGGVEAAVDLIETMAIAGRTSKLEPAL